MTIKNTLTLSETLAEAIRAFASTDKSLSSAATRAGKAATTAVDTFIACGGVWTDLIPVGKDADGVKSTATEESLDFVKANIVATFTAAQQDLLSHETTAGMSKASVKARRYLQ